MERHRVALIEENISLVDHVVRKLVSGFPRHIDRSELESAGRLGLTEAAARFDDTLGVPFAPYAARRIRGSVLDLMRSSDWVPRGMRDVTRQADEIRSRERSADRAAPSDDQVAREIGVGADRLRRARAATTHGSPTTLDSANEADRDRLEHLIDDTVPTIDEVLENRELHGYLRSALASLPERLRVIVVGHYLEGRSLEELAELLDVTSSRVSQLRADAIEIIRHGIDAQFHTAPTDSPKGRVEIRQAQFASSVARHADWRTRLVATRYRTATGPTAEHIPTPTSEVGRPDDEKVIHSA